MTTPEQPAWTDREKRLYDALSHALDYIGDGCTDEGYSAMMTEARAAMNDMRLVLKSKFDDFKVGDNVCHASRGPGIVRAIEDGCVKIEFEDYPGKISAAFDRDWFRVNQALLTKSGPTP